MHGAMLDLHHASPLDRSCPLHLLSRQRCVVCRDLIAQFVSNTFPGPIYPGYAERLAAGKFEVTPSSPGFPVSGVCLIST